MSEQEKTKVMFVCRSAPYGNIFEQEAIEAMIMFGAYEQDISVSFIDDGVYSLKKGQDTSLLGKKNFSLTYMILKDDFEINHIYVEKESLEERGLNESDLITEVEVLDRNALREKMDEMKAFLPF
ncbi:MAG: sulfurtransferase complex subunit TusC [Deltaproteobacteria bacterium]|jgi:tRNA 2-thiouridine synthesizing protein C|nr:sulfurtransferase complex subunit TusC [Deltaproteobacteria bacterium]MCL5879501.1 sulfurtransferase complex subunit TusC [Deltaproteobacteria bacterium]MDA8305120.1 sulfurtransferase complex subunit TusC [Deltaproteobacteria bacterium]